MKSRGTWCADVDGLEKIPGKPATVKPGLRSDVSALFQAFQCRGMHLRNRIVMAPMTRWHSPAGVPGPGVADYYLRRAAGGVGLIITEGTYIDHKAANGYNGLVPVV